MDRGQLTRENVASLKEAAELLGIPRSTTSDYARRGLLPARKVGRRWLFLRDLLHASLLPDGHPDAWRPSPNTHREPQTRITSP
jgi:excisionase family DNA binding protein